MPPKTSDLQEKAATAGSQLREALMSASEALKTIADIVPTLYPSTGAPSGAAPSKPKQKSTTSTSPEVEQTNNAVVPPSSNKRKRKDKDPDAPEKPPSAYHLYAKEKRDEIKAAMAGTPSGNDVVLEINRRWKELTDELKKTYVEAAEKLKGPYQYAMVEYEKLKNGLTNDKPNAEPVQKPADTAAPVPAKSKSTPRKGGGFTAVQASPLALNPEGDADSDDDSQDEAAVAAELGGAQPSASASPAKRQRKESSKPAAADNVKKDKKEKAKEKDKDKDKDKEKRKRRKSGKSDA